LIVANFRANIGNKWNLGLFQQLEDFHFISEVIVQAEGGSPEIEAILSADEFSIMIRKHVDDIGMWVFLLHVGEQFRVTKN
jgi:hypothetical protein